MGRQIHFHMLADDANAFLRLLRENDPVIVATVLDPETPVIHPLEEIPAGRLDTLCVWNRRFLPVLKRQSLGRNTRHYKYHLDTLELPLLEFSPCKETEWEGRPALIQGRLYGQFDPDLNKPREFVKWYERLVRWIRKHYYKNPSPIIGGYVGPAAYAFYKSGGYLLPNFLPVRSQAWLDIIGKQHPDAATNQPAKAPSRL